MLIALLFFFVREEEGGFLVLPLLGLRDIIRVPYTYDYADELLVQIYENFSIKGEYLRKVCIISYALTSTLLIRLLAANNCS